MATKEPIGFIGTGIMGAGMARNLHKAGFPLTVWNRTRERTRPLAEEGIAVSESVRALAEASAVVILCLGDTPDVEAVLFGEGGAACGDAAGKLFIDCSTISPEATKAIAARLTEHGAAFLDAPVSGGSEGAAKGTLSIMVGGAAEDVRRARPAFEAMGRTVTHVGPHGAGQMVKLVNQILVAGSMLAMGEALNFARAGGLDLETTLAAVKDGAAGSWTLSNRGPQVIAEDWRPGFTIDLQLKDLRLVRETADALGVPTFGTDNATSLYRLLQRAGLGGAGNHALIKAFDRSDAASAP
ncbi:MAG: NAD(P)-dependent oxidoreductase [Opitutales bacterium]|nr:NAD(P)-dependent oxidoreductase [Opitutales bacterium]